MFKYIKYLVVFAILAMIGGASTTAQLSGIVKYRWVDSVYNSLSEKERVGQLFMVAAYSGGENYNEPEVTKLVSNNQVGGLIFMQGTPEAQAKQTNKYQKLSKIPLLIGMDAEWGLGMRLTGVKDLPKQMMVGASRDSNLAYLLGSTIADQCKRLGVHINFAPVVDVNNNPRNPIINARSFGEEKELVAQLGIAYMRGLQDKDIIACAKHFPGHGDTETDSHKDLPTINKTIQELDALELYPFKQLINAGVKSMMVAHLNIPALEKEPNTPTTLSYNTITNLLKQRLGFNGLIITDALNMQGVTKYYEPGEADLKAFLAGNDVLLFSQNVPLATEKIQQAIADGKVKPEDLEQRVKKILAEKYDAGLAKHKPIETKGLTNDINKNTENAQREIAEAAITFVRDRNKLMDKLIKGNGSIGYIGVNAGSTTPLLREIQTKYSNIKAHWLPKDAQATTVTSTASLADKYDVTIVAVHNLGLYPSGGDYGLNNQQMSFLKKMESKNNVILVLMGNPYLLKNLCDMKTILVGYEDYDAAQKVMGEVLKGIRAAKGVLPVTPCAGMKKKETVPDMMPKAKVEETKLEKSNAGVLTKTLYIEDAGVVNRTVLDELSIKLNRSVVDRVFPGCQVVAAKNGVIFYDRSIGYQTYEKEKRIDSNTIYDVASLTKVLSTTLAVMYLYDKGKLDINKTIGDYLPMAKGTNKENLKVKDLLLHQAGLTSWIPFYTKTMTEKKPDPYIYKDSSDAVYSIPVAQNMYMRRDYVDTVWKRILESPLENRGKYVYSDLDFFFLAAIVEEITHQRLDVYMENTYYKPMGLHSIMYRPRWRYPIDMIVPTENDNYFRMQLIHGYVHDQGAAMMGGVAGHAGIFSNAEDVAAIFQMLLQGGAYNGKRFLKEETVKYFTAYGSPISRRGLGFDKPSASSSDAGPAGDRTSGYTFGHQGFTGTCAWADPESGVVFVFLSNRVHPSAENQLINRRSIRTVSQDMIYESLGLPINRSRSTIKSNQMSRAN